MTPASHQAPSCGVPWGALALAMACPVLGIASVACLVAGLWPGAGLPAWPAASLGLLALAAGLVPGSALSKALGTIAGTCGLLGAGAQIAVLWAVALFAPAL